MMDFEKEVLLLDPYHNTSKNYLVGVKMLGELTLPRLSA